MALECALLSIVFSPLCSGSCSVSASLLFTKPTGHQLGCSPSVANVSLAESPQVVHLFVEV